jgi:hypothetical protein
MAEKIPTPKPKDEARAAQEAEEMARYEAWMADHPEVEIEQSSPEAVAEVISECESMMSRFEQAHDLEALRAITQFSSKEEREASPRQAALQDLSAIFKRLKYLGSQKNLESEKREALAANYQTLSQAVGNITGDKEGKIFDIVVHDRKTPFPS